MTKACVVEFIDVGFSYPDRGSLFENLSLKFESGAFYSITGPSGSGKSTLLKLINQMETPRSGEIRFDGKPLQAFHPPALRRSILYVQQVPTAIGGSIRENLLLPFSFKSNRDIKKPDDHRLKALLSSFRLDGITLEASARDLSVGELQRICFIRGLLLDPRVVLLDEPTSALDEDSAKIVETRAQRLCEASGQTILMVNHRKVDFEFVTPIMLKLEDGKVQRV
ncbi:MAG: ATP-binding cassette domain-containing protein [Myxococcota bacterium]|nr:ATP-binding cassette domain-containing protein [Myxococcota bacterium]